MKPKQHWFSDPPAPPFEDVNDPDDNLSLLLDRTDGDLRAATRNLAPLRPPAYNRKAPAPARPKRRWKKKRTKEPMMPIFEPLHNAREMAKQLVLLEDHMIQPPKHCPDCIRKHLLTSEALAEEAVSLAQTAPMRSYFQDVAEQLRTISRGYVARRDRGELQQEARRLRKTLSKMGFDSIGKMGEDDPVFVDDTIGPAARRRGTSVSEPAPAPATQSLWSSLSAVAQAAQQVATPGKSISEAEEKKAAEEAGLSEKQKEEFEEAAAQPAPASEGPTDTGSMDLVDKPGGILEFFQNTPGNSMVFFMTMDPIGCYDRIQATDPTGSANRGKWVKSLIAGQWYSTGVLAMGSTIKLRDGTSDTITAIPQFAMNKGGGVFWPNTSLLTSRKVMPYGDGRVFSGAVKDLPINQVSNFLIYEGCTVVLNAARSGGAALTPAKKVESDQMQIAIIGPGFYENDPTMAFYLKDKQITKYRNDLTVAETGKFTNPQLMMMGLIEAALYNDGPDDASVRGLCKRVGVTNQQFLDNPGCVRNVGRNMSVAAIVNAYYESGLNPMAKSGPGEDSVGLFQINRAYLGKDYSVEQLQSAWINTRVIMESAIRQVDKFKTLIEQEARGEPTDPGEWTAIFTEHVERPKDPQASAKARAKTARELFETRKPLSLPTGSLLNYGKDPTGDDMGAFLYSAAGQISPVLYREIEDLDRKVRKLPPNPSTWTLVQANTATAAAENLRRVVNADPNFPEKEGIFAYSRAATIYKEAGQLQGMINTLKELKARYPHSQQAVEAEQLIRRYEPIANPQLPRNASVVTPPQELGTGAKVAIGAAAVVFAGVIFKGIQNR